jgi:hypothetical protein
MDLRENYLQWRDDSNFARFDIQADRLLDELAYQQGKSSIVLAIACRRYKYRRTPL